MKEVNFPHIGIITAHSLEGYGVSVRMNKEICAFRRLGYPVTVFSLVQEGTIYGSEVCCISGSFSKITRILGFDYIANSRYLINYVFTPRRIRELARKLGEKVATIANRRGIKILFTDDFIGSLIGLEAKRNMRKSTIVVGEFADLIYLDYKERFGMDDEDPLVMNLKEMLIEVIKELDFVLFVSPIDAEIATRQLYFSSRKIIVLYEAGDINSPFKSSYELNNSICYLGSISKWEYPDLFLKSYSYAKISNNELIYKVIGAGPILKRMKRLSKEIDGKIIFYGWKPYNEAIDLCLDTDLGVVPTIKERAMPSKLFVYSSLGLPVISMDGMWWSNKIVKAYNIGYVTPPNPEGIGAGISEAMDDPEGLRERGIRARKMIEKHFNWEKRTKKILSLVENEN